LFVVVWGWSLRFYPFSILDDLRISSSLHNIYIFVSKCRRYDDVVVGGGIIHGGIVDSWRMWFDGRVWLSTIFNTGWCSRRLAPAFLFLCHICSWDFWTHHMFHIATKRFLHVFKCSSSLHPTKLAEQFGADRPPSTPNHIKRMFKPRRNLVWIL
jgi:hypothetical protein